MSRRYAIPAHERANELHFDYLTLTFSIEQVADYFGYDIDSAGTPNGVWADLIDFLGLDRLSFAIRKHGIYTYDCSETTAGSAILIGYNKKIYKEDEQDPYFGDKNTIMIQASGEGVKTLNSLLDSQNSDLFEFIEKSFSIGAKCTRCDLACDWYNYKWQRSPLHIYRKIRAGEIKTTFRYWKWMASGSVLDAFDRDDPRRYSSEKEGTTLYLGHNPRQLRIYNKKAERAYRASQGFDVDSWYRWEFQLNDPYANDAVKKFLEYRKDNEKDALQKLYFGILGDVLTVLSRNTNDSNKSRWKPTKWYSEMLGNYAKVHLRYEHEKPTLERKQVFLDKKMKNTIATVIMGLTRDMMSKHKGMTEHEAFAEVSTKFMEDVFTDGKVDESMVSAYVVEQNSRLIMQDRNQDLLKAINKIKNNAKGKKND